MLRLVTNTVESQQVRETDTAYIIEDVPFVRPMELAGGYVPEQSIRETANGWADRPATLNHPRNAQGEPVAAETKPGTHLGAIENPRYDGEFVRGDIRVNKARLAEVGGEARDIRQALENGEPIDVSSQYAAEELPAGEYDGEHRSNVERIVEPDSVALLPNKTGVCSLEDGCGINPAMVANAAVSLTAIPTDDGSLPEDAGAVAEADAMQANQISYEVTNVDPGDVEFTDAEWDGSEAEAGFPNPSEDDDAPDVLDQVYAAVPADDADRDAKSNWKLPFRTGPDAPVNTRALVAIDAALDGARGGVEGLSDDVQSEISEWVASMLDAAPDDLFGAGDSAEMEDNGLIETVVNAVAGVVSRGETTGAESPADDESGAVSSAPDADDTSSMGDKTQDLVANHGFDAENLPDEDTECFDRIYEAVTSNEADTTDEQTEETEMSENAITFESEAEFEEYVEGIVANRRAEERQAELAREIVANSNEYDDPEAVREDYPTEAALETKKEQVTEPESPGLPGGSTAVTGNADASDYPSPIASKRAEQLEGE